VNGDLDVGDNTLRLGIAFALVLLFLERLVLRSHIANPEAIPPTPHPTPPGYRRHTRISSIEGRFLIQKRAGFEPIEEGVGGGRREGERGRGRRHAIKRTKLEAYHARERDARFSLALTPLPSPPTPPDARARGGGVRGRPRRPLWRRSPPRFACCPSSPRRQPR